MKLIISFFILTLFFCNGKQNESSVQETDKKIPDTLLLKVNYFEGNVSITRDKVEIKITKDLELEKEDIIKTGENSSLELLLGIEDVIKLAPNSEITVTNVLNLEGNTNTHISVNYGKILTAITNNEDHQITLITPNLLTSIKESILLTQVTPKDTKNKPSVCDKTTCLTILNVLNGTTLVKINSSASELKLEKNNRISIFNENELAQNMILPIDKNSFPDIKNMLTFQNSEQRIDPKILEEFSSNPITTQVSVKVNNVKVVEKKKATVIPIKKQTTTVSKQKTSTTTRKTYSKDISRDKLKLDSNKKF